VADIFRRHGDAYVRDRRPRPPQVRVIRDVQRCRTAALGGHVQVCDSCGEKTPLYNSCLNRHCPNCQSLQQARWIANRLERVLPVPAFHVVFTLPAELRPLVARNAEVLYRMLFDAGSAVLATLGRQRLGAHLGVTAVLHTWNRKMQLHPHLHCVVTAGGLSLDGTRWIEGNPRYLFPVKQVMSPMFRGKFMALLQRAWSDGKLEVDAPLATPHGWRQFKRSLYAKNWNVYAKRPFKGASHIYAYLGRYTHRVAISSARIKGVSDESVRFRTRGDETIELHPAEFIRRFLLHVLPPGFRKIRHYGLYAPGGAPAARLASARRLVEAITPEAHAIDTAAARATADGLIAALRRCSHCPDGRLVPVEQRATPLPAHPDDDPRAALPPPDTP
jgi:hypothetical protein